MNSQVALEVLRSLSEGDQKYVKELAEDLERSQDSINGYVKLLRDENLIERGKRTQAQYYKINYAGIVDFVIELLTERLEGIRDETEEDMWVEESLNALHSDERGDNVRQFIRKYIQERINEVEDVTLSEFLFNKIYHDLDRTLMLHPELTNEKSYIRWLRTALSVFVGEGKGRDLVDIIK
jgi:DNA-binding transcriptional ArsR family regulator